MAAMPPAIEIAQVGQTSSLSDASLDQITDRAQASAAGSVCTLNANSCQLSADTMATRSDRHHEVHAADDFNPLASAINRLCWTGVWSGTETGVNCNDNPPDGNWYLTIYEDDGNGLPGLVVGEFEKLIFHDGRQIVNMQPDFKPTTYTAPVNISGLTVGGCYWLKISGEGSGDLLGSEACVWNWMHTDTSGSGQGNQSPSMDGNGWSVWKPGNFFVPYSDSSLRKNDYAWCADSGIAKNTVGNEGLDGGCGDRTGSFACCYRDINNNPVCTSTVTLFECILGPTDSGLSGTVFTNDSCPDAGGSFVCSPPVNDDCATGATVIDQSACISVTNIGNCEFNSDRWCSPMFSVCDGGDGLCIPILNVSSFVSNVQYECGVHPTGNRFATTDGPSSYLGNTVLDGCQGSDQGGGPFQADVWWKVVAPCSGQMNVSMRGGGVYNAMAAAYTACPDENDLDVPTLIGCDDDGIGNPFGLPEISTFGVSEGQEVTIRIGGYSPNDTTHPGTAGQASQGQSDLLVRFACNQCPLWPFPIGLGGEAGVTKDRHISIDTSFGGSNGEAIRVTRVGGTEKFLDCTSLQNKGAEGYFGKLIDGPLPPPGDPTYYCDLFGIPVLHMTGCSVVPGNTYNIGVTTDGANFFESSNHCGGIYLPVDTTPPQSFASRRFGDLVGSYVAGAWTSPDGLVTSLDIVAVVKKFQLDPTAPLLARVDTDGAVPNGILAANDILRVVLGFAGGEFGYGVTDCLTGTCVPPQGGACE